MLVQEGHPREGFGATLALVFLDVRVRLQVSPQIGPVCEGPAAVRAGKRLLPWGGGAGWGERKMVSVFRGNANPEEAYEQSSHFAKSMRSKTWFKSPLIDICFNSWPFKTNVKVALKKKNQIKKIKKKI